MRLVHPTAGTVVDLEGDLADRYVAAGWEEVDKPKRAPARRAKPAEPDE